MRSSSGLTNCLPRKCKSLPVIADSLLTSLNLLANACSILRRLCVAGLTADEERCRLHVAGSTATVTALVDKIGYQAAPSAGTFAGCGYDGVVTSG